MSLLIVGRIVRVHSTEQSVGIVVEVFASISDKDSIRKKDKAYESYGEWQPVWAAKSGAGGERAPLPQAGRDLGRQDRAAASARIY